MTTGFLWDEKYAWHDSGHGTLAAPSGGWIEPGRFAEHPAGKRRFRNLLEVSGLLDQLTALTPRPATVEEVTRVHDPDYVARIKTLSDGDGGSAGEGVPFHSGSYEIALLAAGGAIMAVDAVLDAKVDNAYALVRPPGHHAERGQGRGFCIFGNCAIATRHLLEARGLERIAIVDWDVHHGNGTEEAFYEEPRVLTISLHGDNYYPDDRGAWADNGSGAGAGANLNVPLPAGSGTGAYLHAFNEVVTPALRAFQPELILVASGLDANGFDPFGRMLVHSDGYRELTSILLDAAAELCSGRLVFVHEGGYSEGYVPFCGIAVLETLAGRRTEVVDPFLDQVVQWAGQDLQPWQRAHIERAAELIDRVPTPSGVDG